MKNHRFMDHCEYLPSFFSWVFNIYLYVGESLQALLIEHGVNTESQSGMCSTACAGAWCLCHSTHLEVPQAMDRCQGSCQFAVATLADCACGRAQRNDPLAHERWPSSRVKGEQGQSQEATDQTTVTALRSDPGSVCCLQTR